MIFLQYIVKAIEVRILKIATVPPKSTSVVISQVDSWGVVQGMRTNICSPGDF